MLDKDIRREQVQDIRNADGVAALFARLGYRTEAQVIQTAEVLGITPESSSSQIEKIKRIADQEGLLQVYLFEVASLTQALTHTIARAFRNRAGQYLLVLTADYERLDFVLIERLLPSSKTEALVPKQVTLRPRVVSIERQNPGRVHLRLLRRLTYTESDPEFQFEKLRSAFDMAEWSEEFFNNRGLFSDYYLIERVPETEAWKEDPKPAHGRLSELLAKASERWVGKPKAEITTGLTRPALQALGFTMTAPPSKQGDLQPDFLLSATTTSASPVALCLIYPWGRWLDGKDNRRDVETPDHNPGARMVSLLESGSARWAILTNGKAWRLYSGKAHSRATNYYEIDLDETLALPGPQGNDAAEAFRYFWLIFRAKAFETQPSFLDDILSGSEAYAKKLGDRLKDRIFEEIFPIFAEGFIAHIRQRDGNRADLSQPALDHIFQGTLTILYRLLFVLYAESRDLLPVKEYHGYGQKSLKLIKEEIADKAADLEGARDEKLSTAYSATEDSLYRRLMALCAVIDKGDRALNVPMYNGGLFMTEPPEDDTSLEAGNARFIRDHVIPDRWLARGLDRLARDVDDKSHALVFIDYKSLGVRHLGSIYEGLLEFKLRVASEKMAVVEGKNVEEIVPYREAQQEKRKILKAGRGKDAVERVLRPGTVYLENDRRERKATGSYYTPDYIVQYIVEHAVGPVLEEKFEALRPKFRDAQKALKQERDKAAALSKHGTKHDDPEHEAYLKHRQVVDHLFDVKVLDPAMGSGHFLVEAVDFTTDRLLHFLNGFPWNPVLAHLKETRETILQEMERQGISIDAGRLSDVNLLKRHVLKRCIYGVDLNPMAVELAKVSLWLDCFTLGAPLSFLDHHLKCGNSLIGATVEEVDKALETPEQASFFHTSEFARELVAVDLMRRIGELSDVTPEQVRESRREFRKAVAALIPAKTVMDVYVSRWFGNEPVRKTVGAGLAPARLSKKRNALHDFALDFLRADICKEWLKHPESLDNLHGNDRRTAETALKAAQEKRFFHWEIEFPEVFFAPRQGTTQVIERKTTVGFDAVIGNPPYLSVDSFGAGSHESRYFKSAYPEFWQDKTDILVFFLARAIGLSSLTWGMIIKSAFIKGAKSSKLRDQLTERGFVNEIKEFADDYIFQEADVTTATMIGGKILGEALDLVTPTRASFPVDFTKIAKPLRELAHVGQGMQTGANNIFVLPGGDHPFAKYLRRRIRGEDIERYEIGEPVEWVLWMEEFVSEQELPKSVRDYLNPKSDQLRERAAYKRGNCEWFKFTWPLHKEYYDYPKIWTPFRSPYNQFALDRSADTVGLTDTTVIFVTSKTYSPEFLLCVLNSRLMEKIVQAHSKATGGGYHEYFPGNIEPLPIRTIAFTTLKAQRKAITQELIALFESNRFDDLVQEAGQLLPKDQDGLFLAFKPGATGVEEKSDVVHDLLGYLAELMITLNRQKHAETKRFLGWLEARLKIKPSKNGEAGFYSLTGKTTLKGYLGDYQKGTEVQPFPAIVEVLQKNRSRLGISLSDKAILGKIETEYQNSLTKLIPIKDHLARTDRLIDQIVYKLYGLAGDEIAIVERRA